MKRLLGDLDAAVGVCLAIVVAILSAFSVATGSVVSTVVLALLALLLSLFLRLRPTLRGLDKGVEKQRAMLESLEQMIEHGSPASDVFVLDYPDLKEDLVAASEILVIAGGSLRTTVGSFYHQFRSAVSAGARVRLLCPNPDAPHIMELLAETQDSSPDDVAENIRANLRLARKLRGEGACEGSVEIRTLESIPNQGLVHMVKTDNGLHQDLLLLVKLLPFGQNSGAAPVFTLDAARDKSLHELFLAAAEAMWIRASDAS